MLSLIGAATSEPPMPTHAFSHPKRPWLAGRAAVDGPRAGYSLYSSIFVTFSRGGGLSLALPRLSDLAALAHAAHALGSIKRHAVFTQQQQGAG